MEIIPNAFAGFIDDTITFSAIVTDIQSGDTIPSITVFGTSDPTIIEIDSLSGFSRLRSRGSAQISVRVERVVSALFTRLNELGNAIPIDTLRIGVGESVQVCLYYINSDGFLVGKSSAGCPNNVDPFPPYFIPVRQVNANPNEMDGRRRWTIPDNGWSHYIPKSRKSQS